MKQSVKKITLGTAALYCRLSRGDNINNESNSISNHDRKQITILTTRRRYVQRKAHRPHKWGIGFAQKGRCPDV